MHPNRDLMHEGLISRGWYLVVDPPPAGQRLVSPLIRFYYLDGPKLALEDLLLREAATP